MLERIITWSAENRLLVILLTGLVAVVGAWATVNTPVDAIPDLSDVQVIIKTPYAGQAPQVVEDLHPEAGMLLHHRHLLVAQPAGFVEDLQRHPDLADIVQDTTIPHRPGDFGREATRQRQLFPIVGEAAQMSLGVSIFGFH